MIRAGLRRGVYSVCMARVNIYLPDDLARRAREADLNVSGIAQQALERELRVRATNEWLDEVQRLHEEHALPTVSAEVMQQIWDEVDEESEQRADAIADRLSGKGEP